MTIYPALLKREFLDHRGAMLWTPLILGALIAITIIWGAFFVSDKGMHFKNKFGADTVFMSMPDGTVTKPDGTTVTRSTKKLEDGREEVRVTVTDKSGKQISNVVVNRSSDQEDSVTINGKNIESPSSAVRELNNMDARKRSDGAKLMSTGLFAGTTALLLIVAMIMVPFVLLASLFDERQDRSVLFWKSLPITDRDVVLSKLIGGSLLTLGIAFTVGIFLHLLALTSASIVGTRFGVTGIGALWSLPTILNTWGLWLVMILQYVMWAAPVYAWFLLVSASAPRAPFLFAMIIPAALLLFEELFIRQSSFIAEHVFARLAGIPMAKVLEAVSVNDRMQIGPDELFTRAWHALGNGFAEPGLWIGLIVAAILLYATIEMRRRKSH